MLTLLWLLGSAAAGRPGGVASTTPSPTPDPCAWASVSTNTGWDFGDRDGDGRADYFRWQVEQLLEVRMHASGATTAQFPRLAFEHALASALGMVYFVCSVRDTADVPDAKGGGVSVRAVCACPATSASALA